MTLEQTLQNEIKDSQRWIEVEKDESTYKRDLKKRVELINGKGQPEKIKKKTFFFILIKKNKNFFNK